jgi:hypothetical protein
MKRYALKGINDEANECAVCGKVELRRVMWLVELDSDGNEYGQPFHVGTTCGAKLLGYTQSKIKTTVKNYGSLVYQYQEQLRKAHPLSAERQRLLREREEYVKHCGGWAVARLDEQYKAYMYRITDLSRALDNWIAEQPILIQL